MFKKIAEIIVLSLAVLTVVFMTFEIVENLTPYNLTWGDYEGR